MPRAPVLLAVLVLTGCDLFTEADPLWTEPGAVATFDYEPGPTPLLTRQSGEVAPEPAGERVVSMLVTEADRWEKADREVVWREPSDLGGYTTRFRNPGVSFPLDDDVFDLSDDGLRVVVAHQCTGNGWTGGGSGSLAWVRVPRTSGTILPWGNCSREPGTGYPATASVTVTVPAGTFETVRIEHWDGVEYWNWEVGLVRYDVLRYDGEPQGRFVRSAAG